MESWDRIYSIEVRSGARINCLNLLPDGVLTTHSLVKTPLAYSLGVPEKSVGGRVFQRLWE